MTQQPKKKQKIFFPNLDALRFFSYAIVFLFHIWLLFFGRFEITSTTSSVMKFLFQNGEVGVNFFFVLSGFLITYLLIEEKRFTGRINVINFWIRRILRIWPLFYIVVLFGIIAYPYIKGLLGAEPFQVVHPWTYFVFLNNFDFLYNGAPANVSILWSVAIEEQFYICWPLILGLIPLRKFPYAFIIIIAGSLVFRSFHVGEVRVLHFHTLAVIGDMAMGGLLAFVIIFSQAFRKKIENLSKYWILIIYVATVACILFRYDIFQGNLIIFERLALSILFGLIILEQNFSNNSLWKVSNFKRSSRLGIYTYGLYCWHVTSITLLETIFEKAGANMQNSGVLLGVGAIAFFLTLGVAYLSFHYFEKRFLKFKDKFAVITKH